MLYTKLKVSWDEYPKRLNRTLYVKEDIGLYELAVILCISLRTEFEHCFYFMDSKKSYVMDCFMEDYVDDNDLPMKNFSLHELSKSFELIYDNGAYWCFKCIKVEDHVKIRNSKSYFQFVEGQGLGIWEDNKTGLCNYIDGKYDVSLTRNKVYKILDEMDEDDKYEDIEKYDLELMFPWNFYFEKLIEWDLTLTKRNEQRYIKSMLPEVLELFKDDISTGKQYEISHWDNHISALCR